uniref:Maspardin n=1 Tax=Rhinolophus ferrumequinum TaxID=59479 RepID=A0A671EJ59_RHIFE
PIGHSDLLLLPAPPNTTETDDGFPSRRNKQEPREHLSLVTNPPRRHSDRLSPRSPAPSSRRGSTPSKPGSVRVAPATRKVWEEGARRPRLAPPRAPPLGGRPSGSPPLPALPAAPERCGHRPRKGLCRLRGPLLYRREEPPWGERKGTWGRPRQIIVDDDDSKIWSLYDAGPRNVRCPLIFLPPVSGTADVFFRQILALTGWGYRVIALQYPVYWDHLEFCDGFRKLLDHLQLDKVHLFGASLGGFLAQKFAEYTHKSPRVHSLILCNSFSDTSIFNQTWTANSFWLMPSFMLKKIVLGNFSSGPVDSVMADAIDFMVDRLESLCQSELASRLTLNCQNSYVEPHKIRDIPVTIMDVFDQSALSTEAKEEMYKLYPNARRAHLKTGGNFPYLCRSAEVNLYVQIHLLQFHGTKYAAIDPSMVSAEELEVQKGNLGISQEEQ